MIFAVDCWDGQDGEPVIYHGHTLTSKIMFKDVVEACRKYAFEKSDYPVIFSIENHCSLEQQDRMAEHLVNILGDLLHRHTINQEEEQELPSPEQLKRKILIKAKRLPLTTEDDEPVEPADPLEDETDGAKKKKPSNISQNLSDLVNYIQAVHFDGFDNNKAKFYHMSSFGEWGYSETPDREGHRHKVCELQQKTDQ